MRGRLSSHFNKSLKTHALLPHLTQSIRDSYVIYSGMLCNNNSKRGGRKTVRIDWISGAIKLEGSASSFLCCLPASFAAQWRDPNRSSPVRNTRRRGKCACTLSFSLERLSQQDVRLYTTPSIKSSCDTVWNNKKGNHWLSSGNVINKDPVTTRSASLFIADPSLMTKRKFPFLLFDLNDCQKWRGHFIRETFLFSPH